MGSKTQPISVVPIAMPLQIGGVGVPPDWLGSWLDESHGGRRLHAVAEVFEHLQPFGVRGCALVGGSWLAIDPVRPGVEREGPWGRSGLWAEHAGVFPPGWLRKVALAVLAELPEPANSPRAVTVADDTAIGFVVDPSLGGRRPGIVVLVLDPELTANLTKRVGYPAIAWLAVAAAGLLRGDQYRTTGERLAGLLVPHAATGETDRPVNPQEVVARASETVRRLTERGRGAFNVATIGVFLPDPDDEYVYCLAAAGSETYTYDAGVVADKPSVEGVGFGLTATVAMGAAIDPKGGRVAVRVLERRDEVIARYRDLGFDEPETGGGFQSEQFVDPLLLEAAQKGPWVLTAEQLPAALSPTRRNLVVRYQGHLVDPAWATEAERRSVTADRKRWMATFALRLSSEVVGLLAEGLARWRDGLRDEVLRELAGPADLDSIAQRLAHWLSARSVTLFQVEGNALALRGWSHTGPRPELTFDLSRQPGQELRLLRAPLFPRRSALDVDGFLGDPEVLRALGSASENVGTVPIGEGPEPWGVLRVDGAMSLFGGHLGRRSRQRGLVHHRPTVTPQHVRAALDDVARVLALAFGVPSREAPGRHDSWHELLARTRAGLATRDEAEGVVRALRSAARSRGAAAALVGLHRNTFRRQLDELADRLGGPLW
jgi:hypothetical protein